MTKQERALRRLQETAYHEAGHAVMSFELHRGVQAITIVPDLERGTAGHVTNTTRTVIDYELVPGDEEWSYIVQMVHRRATPSHDWTEARFTQEAMITMAGEAAQCRFAGRHDWVGARGDQEYLVDLALAFLGGGPVAHAWLRYLQLRTTHHLAQPLVWAKVTALAEALLDRQTLAPRAASAIVRAVQDPDQAPESALFLETVS